MDIKTYIIYEKSNPHNIEIYRTDDIEEAELVVQYMQVDSESLVWFETQTEESIQVNKLLVVSM